MRKSITKSLVSDFAKSIKRLEEALHLKPTCIHKDATIQRFEFCFELAWKSIQRFLRAEGIECRSPKDCFRKAADFGLIENPAEWFGYLEARNRVSHTYNKKIADLIYKTSRKFPKAAKNLMQTIKDK